jgi:hypothetical protein
LVDRNDGHAFGADLARRRLPSDRHDRTTDRAQPNAFAVLSTQRMRIHAEVADV